MNQVLFNLAEVSQMIAAGKTLIVAGDESLLKQLPQGKWIGGTIPYFMGENGGEFSRKKIYVTVLPDFSDRPVIRFYDETSVQNVYSEAPDHGFSIIIIPAACKTHQVFSLNAPLFPNFATRPLIGWISGIDLKDLGKASPKIFNGQTGQAHENGAVVLGADLPKNKAAILGIANIFEQGGGDSLSFTEDGFSAEDILVNGQKQNFIEYLDKHAIDTRLPLVANYYGALVNTSFQSVNRSENRVSFYAPVFKGMEYKLAKPVSNYLESFGRVINAHTGEKIFFACNCILNYLYSELEGKKTGNVTGPITFGEVAYQLLNQTLAYMTFENI